VVAIPDTPVFRDFCTFARAQIESGDLDPTYPVLRAHYADCRLPEETALWRTILYVTWYSLRSAERVWLDYRVPQPLPPLEGLPTGVERRGFRGNAAASAHVNDVFALAAEHGGLSPWLRGAADRGGWAEVRAAYQAVRGAGPWASYKLADLLAHVHGFRITAPDLGVGGGSETAGPIPGMVRVTGYDWKRCSRDIDLQNELLLRCVRCGVPFSGLDQLETALCDFNSLAKGSYYVGHDIDLQQAHLAGCTAGLWEARRVFADAWRGECGGWGGVRKERKAVYRDTGRILGARCS
jgi:hypothetical protein